MHLRQLKRAGLILVSAAMIGSFCGCQRLMSRKEAESTTETRQARQSNPDYVQADVILPGDFGNMIYPVEALMVEDHSKGLPYFTGESSEENADSFWFSMAVLTSQMNHYVRDVSVETDDRFIYIDEETVNMYASGLYDEFGRGNAEFPDRGEDNPYVTYNTDKGIYGFRQGTIGDLEPYVTDCQEKGGDYVLTVHLKNKDSAEILSSYEVTITPTSYENEENAFAYSVKDFQKAENADPVDFSEKDSTEEGSSEASETEEEETTAESETTSQEESSENSNETSSGGISEEEALSLAEDYYGESAEYTYKETVTIGDYEYYDFAVSGDDVSATDVLVSVDGENVMGGVKNSDGSWSFDQ